MKKLLLAITMICSFVFAANAQTDSIAVKPKVAKPKATLMQLDSASMAKINAIYDNLEASIPRYKIYQTENIHILLKLDTATGRVWMVQYGTGDKSGMVVPVDDTSLLYSWDIVEAGRFELYPTKNMYNFILIDTHWGDTYQVQWHTSENSRMRVRLY